MATGALALPFLASANEFSHNVGGERGVDVSLFCLRGGREQKLEADTIRPAFRFDSTAVQSHDRIHERKPQAGSLRS